MFNLMTLDIKKQRDLLKGHDFDIEAYRLLKSGRSYRLSITNSYSAVTLKLSLALMDSEIRHMDRRTGTWLDRLGY